MVTLIRTLFKSIAGEITTPPEQEAIPTEACCEAELAHDELTYYTFSHFAVILDAFVHRNWSEVGTSNR